MISLGTISDGRRLSYDATLYEFRIERELATYAELLALDRRGHVRWAAPEQRDWFRRLDPALLDRCNRRALRTHGNGYGALTAEEQVQADAKRDDSVLAGKIVEADPALVHAVALSLEEQGLLGGGSGQQTVIGMPEGMEALSQLQKQRGRKMTVMEHFLMRQILKNDDKEKARRQKQAEALEEEALKEEARNKEELEKRGKISAGQRRMEKKEAREEAELRRRSASMKMEKTAEDESGYADTMELEMARLEAATAARAAQRYDSFGNPIAPEPSAIRPSMSQQAYGISEEEKALSEMRARNLAEQARYENQATDVPGMEKGSRRRNEGASINGRAVNPDGTPKREGFRKFLKGAGEVVDALAPMAGGGRGGGGGMGGGSGMGGMGGGRM